MTENTASAGGPPPSPDAPRARLMLQLGDDTRRSGSFCLHCRLSLLGVLRWLPRLQVHTASRGEKGALSSSCLSLGAENPFPESPSRLLLTVHWPELGHMSLPKPESTQRGGATCLHQPIRIWPCLEGRSNHGRGQAPFLATHSYPPTPTPTLHCKFTARFFTGPETTGSKLKPEPRLFPISLVFGLDKCSDASPGHASPSASKVELQTKAGAASRASTTDSELSLCSEDPCCL